MLKWALCRRSTTHGRFCDCSFCSLPGDRRRKDVYVQRTMQNVSTVYIVQDILPEKPLSTVTVNSDTREHLMWCTDEQFDHNTAHLDMRGLIELIQMLQDAMTVEQQTFDSLSAQLEELQRRGVDDVTQQRLSAALCTSQTRLARLCSRNMRCFMQQALRSRPHLEERLGMFEPATVDRRRRSSSSSTITVNGELVPEDGGTLTLAVNQEPVSDRAASGAERWRSRSVVTITSDGDTCANNNNPRFYSLPRKRSTGYSSDGECYEAGTRRRSFDPSPGLSRTQSYKEGLDRTYCTLTRASSFHDSLDRDSRDDYRLSAKSTPSLRRVPSVDEILESVKALRSRQQSAMVKSGTEQVGSGHQQKQKNHKNKSSNSSSKSGLSSKFSGPAYKSEYSNLNHIYRRVPDPDYEKDGDVFYENVRGGYQQEVQYENVRGGVPSPNDELPVYANVSEPTYMNVNGDVVYENVGATENKVTVSTYDVPRTATHIYDTPRPATTTTATTTTEYDTPRSAKIVLSAVNDGPYDDCDRDSLEGAESGSEPEIPSPDYCSDEECLDEFEDGYRSGEYSDEGIGESDARSYYTEDQGLEVILEEPEEDYCSSEEDLGKIGHEEVSLEGSEGIGSADSGSHSSGGFYQFPENESSRIEVPPPSPEEKDDRAQQDRCVEVYNETVRQRNNAAKINIRNLDSFQQQKQQTSPKKDKDGGSGKNVKSEKRHKFLPSVKALRHQFESKSGSRSMESGSGSPVPRGDSPSGASTSSGGDQEEEVVVRPFMEQFEDVDDELLRPRQTTLKWDPTPLLQKLYVVPEPQRPCDKPASYVNIEGYLDKLPSGRRKATFWNAWKRRYFKAKDGYLYYYQNNQTSKPSLVLQLMGGKIDSVENTMIGVDDGKGHYVVVRCTSPQETERWHRALQTHTVENFHATFTQPWPVPTTPSMIKDTIIIDLGSCSLRAGILCTQPTLPQVFFPTIVAADKEKQNHFYGYEALKPNIRSKYSVNHPVRPSAKITKYSVDLPSVTGLLEKALYELNVDPREYHVQLSMPRSFTSQTQVELLKLMFDKFGVRSVNMTHQTILALCSYNTTSGIVVDIGDRMDIIPIVDGYIIEGGVSRVPYGGHKMLDHLRHFLLQRNHSFVTDVEQYMIRHVLEQMCYVAHNYIKEMQKYRQNPAEFEKSINIREFYQDIPAPTDYITLDAARFQTVEGLFNPDAWGLDNQGVQKLVHKAVQECSMDVRKEMVRSIYLSGGVTCLPGFAERLQVEVDRLTPLALQPKVHGSPYRYHAAYLGACTLASSSGFAESRASREDWDKIGAAVVKRWKL